MAGRWATRDTERIYSLPRVQVAPPLDAFGAPTYDLLEFTDGLPNGWDAAADTAGHFDVAFRLARSVYHGTACDLPGVLLKYEPFMAILGHAVRAGMVAWDVACYVAHTLRWGTDMGVKRDNLRGHSVRSNYKSSTGDDIGKGVSEFEERLSAQRTLDLGAWSTLGSNLLSSVFGSWRIAPIGLVVKGEKNRLVTDHTASLFNGAYESEFLRHTIDSMNQLARHLLPGYSMGVFDVRSAFQIIPVAVHLWPHMMSKFRLSSGTEASGLTVGEHLLMPLAGDFGTSGMPGVFKVFYDCVIGMARAFNVITLPIAVHVDDSALMGASVRQVQREMDALMAWAEDSLGLQYKADKTRAAAQCQVMIGFVWNSFDRTRTLVPERLTEYVAQLIRAAASPSLSLSERQSLAGRMQRAALTLPREASSLIAETYGRMSGLTLPWHRRRTNRQECGNFLFIAEMLTLNLGRGLYSLDQFIRGPTIYSDASKGDGYCGGGYFSTDGRADYFVYGSASKRKPIDFLEGDTIVSAVERWGYLWAGMIITFMVDNQAFQLAAGRKKWSKAERLNLLIKRLLVLMVKGNFFLEFVWLSTHDNYLSDHLSRGRIQAFFELVYASGVLHAGVRHIAMEADAGRIRWLDRLDPTSMGALALFGAMRRDPVDQDVQSAMIRACVQLQAAVRGWLARVGLRRERAALERAYPNAAFGGLTRMAAQGGMRVYRLPWGTLRYLFFGLCLFGQLDTGECALVGAHTAGAPSGPSASAVWVELIHVFFACACALASALMARRAAKRLLATPGSLRLAMSGLIERGWALRRSSAPPLMGHCARCHQLTERRCSMGMDEWYCAEDCEVSDAHAHFHRTRGQCGVCTCRGSTQVLGSRVFHMPASRYVRIILTLSALEQGRAAAVVGNGTSPAVWSPPAMASRAPWLVPQGTRAMSVFDVDLAPHCFNDEPLEVLVPRAVGDARVMMTPAECTDAADELMAQLADAVRDIDRTQTAVALRGSELRQRLRVARALRDASRNLDVRIQSNGQDVRVEISEMALEDLMNQRNMEALSAVQQLSDIETRLNELLELCEEVPPELLAMWQRIMGLASRDFDWVNEYQRMLELRDAARAHLDGVEIFPQLDNFDYVTGFGDDVALANPNSGAAVWAAAVADPLLPLGQGQDPHVGAAGFDVAAAVGSLWPAARTCAAGSDEHCRRCDASGCDDAPWSSGDMGLPARFQAEELRRRIKSGCASVPHPLDPPFRGRRQSECDEAIAAIDAFMQRIMDRWREALVALSQAVRDFARQVAMVSQLMTYSSVHVRGVVPVAIESMQRAHLAASVQLNAAQTVAVEALQGLGDAQRATMALFGLCAVEDVDALAGYLAEAHHELTSSPQFASLRATLDSSTASADSLWRLFQRQRFLSEDAEPSQAASLFLAFAFVFAALVLAATGLNRLFGLWRVPEFDDRTYDFASLLTDHMQRRAREHDFDDAHVAGWRDPAAALLSLRAVTRGCEAAVTGIGFLRFKGCVRGPVAACRLAQAKVAAVHAARRSRDARSARRSNVRGMAFGLFAALLFCMCVPSGAAPGPSRLDVSVQYPRATLTNGMRADVLDRFNDVMDNRLAESSMRTVMAARGIWQFVCQAHGWDVVLQTDDEERGAKLVTFILYMTDHRTDLTFHSIQSYVWGLVWWTKLQNQADPRLGVMHYSDFMASIKVLAWVPHEPRRCVPLKVLRDALATVDNDVFWEVCLGLLCVILLFTFARSASAIPKAFTGEESFDDKKHWMVRDIVVKLLQGCGNVLGVRFKATKTDPRIERPSAQRGDAHLGGSDWAYVGDVPDDPIFSVFTWYRRYMSFFPSGRAATDPFFLSRCRMRPLTYSGAVADLRTLIGRVQSDVDFGLHGLRVLGYNLSKDANGEELTVAHGGWTSAAHLRYQRFSLRSVCGIAANMVGARDPYDEPAGPRDVGSSRGTIVRGTSAGPSVPPRAATPNPYAASSDEEGAASPDRSLRSRGVAPPPPGVAVARPMVVATVVSPAITRGRGRGGRGGGSSSA